VSIDCINVHCKIIWASNTFRKVSKSKELNYYRWLLVRLSPEEDKLTLIRMKPNTLTNVIDKIEPASTYFITNIQLANNNKIKNFLKTTKSTVILEGLNLKYINEEEYKKFEERNTQFKNTEEKEYTILTDYNQLFF